MKNALSLTGCSLLLLSACSQPACGDGGIDPYFYRVKGIRVPYSMIGL